ncbi:MAG: cation-transporting P-type ATPase [Weeksellaceae bacterium]|nr:cation-transporting P-type ATPase [Weeksellaceae bacterium]
MPEDIDQKFYTLSQEETLSQLNTSEEGLSESEVKSRQEKYGKNQLEAAKTRHPLLIFIDQFNQPLIYILLAATIVTFFLQEYIDSAVIFAVVIINSVIGFIEENKALRAIKSLQESIVSEANVTRDGKKQQIDTIELVPGDIVHLKSGDKVPADMRLLSTKELRIEEAALTGESVPVSKETEKLEKDIALGDRLNMVYSSTLVTSGTATAVVTRIGSDTEVGKINTMISSADLLDTPLTQLIAQFSRVIIYAVLILAVITLGIGLLQGYSFTEIFMASVALAVGLIPEGLPAAVTITLALGVSKMAKRQAVIRKLPAVETLGSTNVICSDKTGTLTRNEMTVQRIYAGDTVFQISGVGYNTDGEITLDDQQTDPQEHSALYHTLLCGLLCNEAKLKPQDSGYKLEGDPTEGALLVAAEKAGLDFEDTRQQYKRIDTLPFESEHQYMATLHQNSEGDNNIIFVKGSVERILERCSQAMDAEGNTQDLNAEQVEKHVEEFASQGQRVLALAMKTPQENLQDLEREHVEQDLTFLGLQGMIDPPREEVIEAVQKCHDAGIDVKMITGDHELTAYAIAKEIGIVEKDAKQETVNGRKIAETEDDDLVEIASNAHVFARVAPEHKLRLVRALQSQDKIVAMTGDGVNDAPSLRQANIGIAMGITGTDVAKETSDMILMDDNFASIESAIEEGRGVFDNLLKFITWTLPTNFGEGMVLLLAIVMGMKIPILPVQILWINLATAIFLGIMLAWEKPEPGIMTRPPRKDNSILTSALIYRIIVVGLILSICSFIFFNYALNELGRSPEQARTLVVNTIIVGEIFFLFNCRSLRLSFFKMPFFSNPLIFLGVGLMTLAQVLYTYWGVMNNLFQSAPLPFIDWLFAAIPGVIIFISVEFHKWWVNRNKQ